MTEINWDYEYSPSMWCKDQTKEEAVPNFVKNCDKTTKLAYKELLVTDELVYGKELEQKIVILQCKECPEKAPLLCFLHGGYWQEITVEQSVGFALAVK